MKARNGNVDYCGAVHLLRYFVQKGLCSEQDAKKVASRIAADLEADVYLPL